MNRRASRGTGAAPRRPSTGRASRLLLLVAALGGALGWWWLSHPHEGASTTSDSGPATTATRPGTPRRWAWHADAGRRYRFTADILTSVSDADGRARSGQHTRFGGRLDLAPRDTRGDVLLAARLGQTWMELDGRRDEARAEQLHVDFELRYLPDGRLRDVVLPADMDESLAAQLQTALFALQAGLPAGAPSLEPPTTWALREDDATGTYDAEYGVSAPGRIVKSKQAYTSQHGDLSRIGEVGIDASSAEVTWSPDRFWIDGLTLAERTHLQLSRGGRVDSELRVELLALDDAARGVTTAPLSGVDDTAPIALRPSGGSGPDPSRDRCLALLESLGGGSADLLETQELARLLAARPDLCPLVLERIDRGDVTGGDLSRLMHTLEVAGTPEAQATLAAVVSAPFRPVEQRVYAAVALGGVAEPTTASLDVLMTSALVGDDSADVQSGLVLGVGRMARRLPEGGDDQLRAATFLRDLLLRARDASEAGLALRAMGNSRRAEWADEIVPWLRAEDRRARIAAAEALARTPHADVPAMLSAHLVEEPEPQVRVELLRGLTARDDLGERDLTVVQARLDAEPVARVRAAMVALLGRHLEAVPDARNTLQTMLEGEADPDVRREIIRALAP